MLFLSASVVFRGFLGFTLLCGFSQVLIELVECDVECCKLLLRDPLIDTVLHLHALGNDMCGEVVSFFGQCDVRVIVFALAACGLLDRNVAVLMQGVDFS